MICRCESAHELDLAEDLDVFRGLGEERCPIHDPTPDFERAVAPPQTLSDETRKYLWNSCAQCGQEGHTRTTCPNTGTIDGPHVNYGARPK